MRKTKDGHALYKVHCNVCNEDIERGLTYQHIKRGFVTCDGHRRTRAKRESVISRRLRKIYGGIRQRCYNPNCLSYRFYGEKNIKMCEEWEYSYSTFQEWALANGYKENLTIDRIDSSKDYSPDNCRWIPLDDNAKYKSSTRSIQVNGIIDSGRGWARRLGLNVNAINEYVRKHGVDNTIKYISSIM